MTRNNKTARNGGEGVIRLPAMSKKETEALIKSCNVCRMALND